MRQNELTPPKGAKHRAKRMGRGFGSGHGRTSGRGTKGQKSRSGYSMRPGFEGGQNPQTKKLPELRGFTNIFRKEYTTINIERLNHFDADSEVTPQALVQERIIKSLKYPVKVLGNGELDRPLRVKANKFTHTARRKIEEAGGQVEEL